MQTTECKECECPIVISVNGKKGNVELDFYNSGKDGHIIKFDGNIDELTKNSGVYGLSDATKGSFPEEYQQVNSMNCTLYVNRNETEIHQILVTTLNGIYTRSGKVIDNNIVWFIWDKLFNKRDFKNELKPYLREYGISSQGSTNDVPEIKDFNQRVQMFSGLYFAKGSALSAPEDIPNPLTTDLSVIVNNYQNVTTFLVTSIPDRHMMSFQEFDEKNVAVWIGYRYMFIHENGVPKKVFWFKLK